jgi:hypothetical protein
MITINNFLIIIIFFVNIYFYNASYSPYITYLSYYTSTIDINDNNYNNYNYLNIVKNSDDYPFESINLPFNFNFFGLAINSIYVSPNGAIHTIPTQPCPSSNHFLNWGNCENFNGTYYSLIAGI